MLPRMKRFPHDIVTAIRDAVVVENRVFVRRRL